MTTEHFPAPGYRAVFYKAPRFDKRNAAGDYLVPRGERLIYTAPVLRFAVSPPTDKTANGAGVGYSLVLVRDGAVRAYSQPTDDFLGVIEPGRDPARCSLVPVAHQRARAEAQRLRQEERIQEMTQAAMDAASKENDQ
ncbi:hypothetical protein ACFPFX_09200 [Streptomyces mauvecolor]|uniref:Uncharacterized protein n=1 Tax=Streptomyces mauvecolor TaxID=58345 RepID=A0ABV9UM42_9ACTN